MTTPASQWQRIIDGLEKDRAAQCARADRLQLSLDRIAEQMALQADDLRAIRKMLRRRETQLAKAEAEVRKLRRKLGLDDPEPEPDAAEVPDEDESADEDTDAGTDAAPTAPAPRSPKSKTRSEADGPPKEPTPRKPRVGGRRAPPAHIPADREHYGVCACSRCGGRVLKRDVEQSAVYSAVRSYVRQRIIQRERVVCADPQCGAATTAPMPPMPCARALFDCSFLAWLVTMKFGYMIPLDRIQAQLASQGVFLATGTLVHLIERATALADAVDGEHMKQLRAGKYICFDGTGLKVLIAGQPKAWDGYLEVYTREQVTVFQFDLTKHADELRERLGNLAAILVTDAESRNKAGAPNAKFGHCNAHVVRAFRDAARVQPTLAREGCAFVDRLHDVEQEARALGLVGEEFGQHRQKCRPILTEFRAWLERIEQGDLPPSDPVLKIAKYYLRHWDGLTLFVEDPDIPIDNNEAEREFQRHAKLRLASLFAGSIEGAHRWATLLGVVRTAQKHDLDVQAYLTWMFERRGTHKARFGMRAKDLTPAAYKTAGCPGSLTGVEAVAVERANELPVALASRVG